MSVTRKVFILLILSCLNYPIVFAQKHNSFIGIRFGAALPMGELASHNYGYGGYALLGKSYGLEGAWFITPKIGLGLDYNSNSFEFASGYYSQDVLQANSQDYSHVSVLSSPYKIKTFMGGIYYKIHGTSKFSSTIKLMAGMFRASTPDQLYNIITISYGNLSWWKTSASNLKWTFLTGLSLEYKLYDQVTLLLQTDFTYARPSFRFIKSQTESYVDYISMPVFRVQPGLNIHF